PMVAAALDAGVPVDNDVGLFFGALARPEWGEMDSPPRVVAVTGSNGKSTTSALIAHLLEAAGKSVHLGGNIGRGVLDLDPPEDGGVVVLELSSYQTELARALTPDIAVFLNLSPDHLDRHGGMGGYFAAKRRLFSEGGPDRAVVGVDEAEGRFLASQLSVAREDDRVIRIATSRRLEGPGWRVEARRGFLAEWRKGRQVAAVDLRGLGALAGAHNHQNACAAWAVARALGIGPRQIEAGLASFPGLPHRSQPVAEIGGVRFINDSKATNAEAAARALSAHARVRWIAGGQGKEGGIAALAPHFGRVARAYLIGSSARDFAAQLGETPHLVCDGLEEAVAQAAADALPGEVVLLAPAAASFDSYADFEARGAHFIALVEALARRSERG
ncbi:MAG: UDP-N-acetylmuramoyl-L-alanine--D-glutamate ligase, partial [Rhodobacteraceae bacterium]|nr:UDP-N-acetylmuramoyl-L-alanine--D-glutamate ligase [Paracoccaceae bacterium]